MVELPVPPREIHHIYSSLIEDVSERERQISDELPTETTADIPSYLRGVVDNWENSRKSLRTVPVCNVHVRECERRTPESVEQTLTGLDAAVNVLDDIIDTKGLPTESKVALTANVAFSTVLMIEGCPPESKAAIKDILLDYFTALFQIPLVERELFDQLTNATSVDERRDAAQAIYAYRARDIDAFSRITSTVMNVDSDAERRLRDDLRTYRARRLLFKDIVDVERDLADGDTTPLIHFLRTGETVDEVVGEIEHLYARFAYSDVGQERYGDLLEELEDQPDDLHSLIRQTQETSFGRLKKSFTPEPTANQ